MGVDSPPCRKTFVVVGRRGAGTAANQGSSPSRRHFWKLTDPKGRQGSAEGHLGGLRKSISDISQHFQGFKTFWPDQHWAAKGDVGARLSSKPAAQGGETVAP